MKKYERVKSNLLFNSILNRGKKVSNQFFTLFFIEKKEEKPLFGVTVPKRLGKAVIRNRLKRQVRELINNNKFMFKKNRNYIIIVKEKCLGEEYNNMEKAFIKLIGDTNEK